MSEHQIFYYLQIYHNHISNLLTLVSGLGLGRVKAIFDQKIFFQLKCDSGAVLSAESEYGSQIGQFES